MPHINLYINEEQEKSLKLLAHGDESLGKLAKRILVEGIELQLVRIDTLKEALKEELLGNLEILLEEKLVGIEERLERKLLK